MQCYDVLTEGNYKLEREFNVRANDPLFLMKNAIISDYYKKSSGFHLFREENFSVPNKETKINVKLSKVLLIFTLKVKAVVRLMH